MNSQFNTRLKGLLMGLLKPIVYIWMRSYAKTHVTTSNGFKFNRKEPYLMLANHTYKWDVVNVPLRLKKTPYIIGSQTLFRKQPYKFLVTYIARVIKKTKGDADIRTVREILSAVKNGYPILIFPEGNVSFFGETGYIEESTYKLVKKLKIDLVTAHVKGGYLTRPRWQKANRKHKEVFIDYKIVLTKDEIKTLSVEEIADICKKELYQNDYLWNKQQQINYKGSGLTNGLEDILYVCPDCFAVNSLSTKDNTITCNNCNITGELDGYGEISNFSINNIPAWDRFQRTKKQECLSSIFETTAIFETTNYDTLEVESFGEVIVRYNGDNYIYLENEMIKYKWSIEDIHNPILLLRHELDFRYREKNYTLYLNSHIMIILRILQDKY